MISSEITLKVLLTIAHVSAAFVPPEYANCSSVKQFGSNEIIQGSSSLDIMGVKGISYSIGYSVIDKVGSAQISEHENQMCRIRMIGIINRYGKAISPSVAGAQASVRATNFNDKTIQSCPGFGLCANIWDAADKDVYPISTLTYIVVRTSIKDEDCGRMKIVYDYLKWILTDPIASSVVTSQSFATMPKKVAKLAVDSVLNQIQCQNADASGPPRLLMNEPIPSHSMTVLGGGSSLQGNLQVALLQTYSGAGVSKISYDSSLGSGGGQCLLTVGSVNCWYNTTSKRHVNCLQFGKDPVSGAQVCTKTAPFQLGIDFAGSDSIITTTSLTVKEQGQRMMPVFAAAISLVHSLPVPSLVFSRDVANDVFLGNIVRWNDPRIQATNPDVALPDMHIIRLVRSDSSGTTQAFDRALAAFANVDFMWGTSNYWNSHPLKGSSLPTWPVANYTTVDSAMICEVTHCSRSVCSPGNFLNPQLDSCEKCPVGTFSDTTSQNLACKPCPTGHYSDSPGAALCSKCTENSYQDEIGQVSCKRCPDNTRRFLIQEEKLTSYNRTVIVSVDSSGTSIDDCKCVPGFWLPSSLLNTSSVVETSSHRRSSSHSTESVDPSLGYTSSKGGEVCVKCPQGASCPGFENNFQTIPRPLDGYWGRPQHPFLFYECRDSVSCYPNYRCGKGHDGRMCKIETHGYFTVGEKWYLECPANFSSAAALTIFLTALVVFIWLQIMKFAEGSIYDSFDVGIKFLHLIGFIAQFPLRWHPNLDFVFLILLVANLEINFISPHCIWPTFTGATAFYFQLFVPFVIVGASTLYWILKHRFFEVRKVTLSQAEVEPLLNRKCLRDGSISMPDWQTYATNKSLQVFAFMYQVLVFKNFSCFLCRSDPDGTRSFLYTAPDIECGTSVHISMMVTAVLYAIFVIFGFPFYMCRVLFDAKENNLLVRNDFIMKYGSFFQAWKVEYVWWEVVVLARKFFIGIILALCSVPMIQGALAMILIYVSIMLHLSAAPYMEDWNNTLELMCLFCALAYTACGMIFYPSLDQNINCVGTSSEIASEELCQRNTQIKEIASLCLILLVTATFLLTVASTCWEVYERLLSRKTSKYIQKSKKWFGLKDRSDKIRAARPSMSGAALASLLPLFGRTSSADSSQENTDETTTPRTIRKLSLWGPKANSLGGGSSFALDSRKMNVNSLGGGSGLSPSGHDSRNKNKVFPDVSSVKSNDVESVRPKPTMASRLSREESMEDGPAKWLNAVQLRLSDMLDGYFMTSWKDMLIEMETKDENIRNKYSEENEASTLLDQERLYLELDAYLPRFSCHLITTLNNHSTSSVSAFLRKLLVVFPGIIDYMITATEEARGGFSHFVKDFVTFCEDRPQFFDGSGRDSVIAHEYRSLVADWLIKHDKENVEVCKTLLDEICAAAGLRMHAPSSSGRKESVFEALSRIKSQKSFGKFTRAGTHKETAFQALRRMGTQRTGLLLSTPKPVQAAWARSAEKTGEMASVLPASQAFASSGLDDESEDELADRKRESSAGLHFAERAAHEAPTGIARSEIADNAGEPTAQNEHRIIVEDSDAVHPFNNS